MDDRKRILLLAVAGAVVLSLLCIILPGNISKVYISVMEPIALLAGFVFGIQVANYYTRELKKSFLFLSLFLLLYIFPNITFIWDYLFSTLGKSAIFIVLALQVADYAMLLLSCYYTIKVIDVKRMNRFGWAASGILSVLCLYIIYAGLVKVLPNFPVNPAVAVSSMVIRVFDMAVILMLIPVFFLYIQYLRAKAQESVTFTFIMCGLILSLFSTYIVEIFVGASSGYDFEGSSLLNALYLFGYLLMVIGLYAGRRYDEWGFKMIEKALK